DGVRVFALRDSISFSRFLSSSSRWRFAASDSAISFCSLASALANWCCAPLSSSQSSTLIQTAAKTKATIKASIILLFITHLSIVFQLPELSVPQPLHSTKRLATSSLGILRYFLQHPVRILWIVATVPQQQSLGNIASSTGKFLGQHNATNFNAHHGATDFRQKSGPEAMLACNLPHHLH